MHWRTPEDLMVGPRNFRKLAWLTLGLMPAAMLGWHQLNSIEERIKPARTEKVQECGAVFMDSDQEQKHPTRKEGECLVAFKRVNDTYTPSPTMSKAEAGESIATLLNLQRKLCAQVISVEDRGTTKVIICQEYRSDPSSRVRHVIEK